MINYTQSSTLWYSSDDVNHADFHQMTNTRCENSHQMNLTSIEESDKFIHQMTKSVADIVIG